MLNPEDPKKYSTFLSGFSFASAGFLTGCTFLLVFFLYALPLPAHDAFGAFRQGKWILEHRAIPERDVFSWGQTHPYIYSGSWFSDVLFYLIFNFTGWHGIQVFKAVVGCAASFFLWKSLRRKGCGVLFCSVWVLYTAAILMFFFNVRPGIFTILFFTLFLYLFLLFKEGNKAPLFCFPFCFLLWTPLHGGYVLGILFLELVLGLEFIRLRSVKLFLKTYKGLILSFLACVLAANAVLMFWQKPEAVAPGGFQAGGLIEKAGIFIGKLLGIVGFEKTGIMERIVEWKPLDFSNPFNFLYVLYLFFCVVAAVLALRHLDFTAGLLAFVFGLLPFFSQRHIPLSVLMLSVSLAPAGYKYVVQKKLFQRVVSLPFYHPARAFCVFSFLLFLYLFSFPYRGIELSGERFVNRFLPVGAVKFIKETGMKGPLFNDLDWGGYCLWRLYPQYKVGLDARYGAAYASEYITEYLDALMGKPNALSFLAQHKVNLILIELNRPLVDQLLKNAQWAPVYMDQGAVVLLRNVPENEAYVDRYAEEAFNKYQEMQRSALIRKALAGYASLEDALEHYLHAGSEFLNQKDFKQAMEPLQNAVLLAPESIEANINLGAVYFYLGEPGEAKRLFIKVVTLAPDNKTAHLNLAHIYRLEGNSKKAEAEYKKVLKLEPQNNEAKQWLEEVTKDSQ